MADLDQSTEGTGTSVEAPASNGGGVDLESIKAAIFGELDKRFSGMQSLIDKRVGPLAEQLSELKTASLSPEEREQFEEQAAQAQLEALRRENAMLRLKERFPRGVNFLDQFTSQESLEAQLAFIEENLGKGAAQAVAQAVAEQAAEEGAAATPADANNPPRENKPGLARALAGGQMTEAMADEILAAAGNTPLAQRRRGQL